MKRVVIESPFSGKRLCGTDPWLLRPLLEWWRRRRNMRYLRACLRDCILRGEAPYASHGLYTQASVLRDHVKEERDLGIKAGFEWGKVAELTVVYVDLGITKGMEWGIEAAATRGTPVEFRSLAPWRGKQPSPVQPDAPERLPTSEGAGRRVFGG